MDELDLPEETPHPNPSSYQAERRKLQQNYLDKLRNDNYIRYYANSYKELELIIYKIRDELSEFRKDFEKCLESDKDFKTQPIQRLDELKYGSLILRASMYYIFICAKSKSRDKELVGGVSNLLEKNYMNTEFSIVL